jgi:hypothetical protein
MTPIAFIIGNGRSRLDVDLNTLRGRGMTYGCNALYRDFVPDVLIATDNGIAKEIQESGYAKTNRFYTRRPQEGSGAKPIEYNYGWSSGQVALSYAAHAKHSYLYMIGFDLAGLESNTKFNNVYAGTDHYKRSEERATFYGNWLKQIHQTATEFKNTRFVRVIAESGYEPPELGPLKNLQHMSTTDFKTVLNTLK